jgi:surfeit locus 1 family protein
MNIVLGPFPWSTPAVAVASISVGGVLRAVLTPRWLGLHALLVGLLVAFGALGHWQLDRAREEAKPRSGADKPAIALADLVDPAGTVPPGQIGRRVTASGVYDPAHQLLVTGRGLQGRDGYWVLTPLRTGADPAVIVVRGWVASPTDPGTRTPSGPVEVTGRLQPAEPLGGAAAEPGTQITSITTTDLIQRLPYDIYDGYVVLSAQSPAAGPAPARVEAPLRAAPRSTFPLQNAAYAVQWWVFGLFALVFWWRMVRDTLRRTTQPAGDKVAVVLKKGAWG